MYQIFFYLFFSGDEIFSINSVPVQGMTHGEAIGLFKEVKKGPIVVTIGRRAAAASTTSLSLKPASSNQIATTHEVEEWNCDVTINDETISWRHKMTKRILIRVNGSLKVTKWTIFLKKKMQSWLKSGLCIKSRIKTVLCSSTLGMPIFFSWNAHC